MPKSNAFSAPKYRHYRPKNLGVVRLNGRDFYLGEYGSPESYERYHRLVAEWLANDRQLPSRFDRNQWTLGLYQAANKSALNGRIAIDCRGNGPYARAEVDRGYALHVLSGNRDLSPARECVEELAARIAGCGAHQPRYIYAAIEVPDGKFLLYAPSEEPDYEDDWPLDIRLYSRSFRADRASILLQELGLVNQTLRTHIADRRKFFDAKERLRAGSGNG